MRRARVFNARGEPRLAKLDSFFGVTIRNKIDKTPLFISAFLWRRKKLAAVRSAARFQAPFFRLLLNLFASANRN